MESQAQFVSKETAEAGIDALQTWETPELKVSLVAEQTQDLGATNADGVTLSS